MTVRSPYPDVKIPDVPLPTLVLERALQLGDKPALIGGPSGRTITYAQLAGLTAAVAGGFASRGLRQGDVVAIFGPNLPEYAVAFHGVAAAGGVNATVNSPSPYEDVKRQLAQSRARFLVTVEPFVDRALPAAKHAGVEEVFVLGETSAGGPTPFAESPALGQAGAKAFVVRRADVTGGELMSWVSEGMSSYKKIRRVEFVDEIPRSASGKILRRVLVERERREG